MKERPDFEKLASITPQTVAKDPSLTHADRTCWDEIQFHAPNGTCWYSLRELADYLNTDHKQVLRSVLRLEAGGHIKRLKRGNIHVGIEITSKYFEKAEVVAKEGSNQCLRCRADRPRLDAIGICVVCRQKQTAQMEVAVYFETHGVGQLHEVWAYLKGHGSKSSQKNIERAYNAALDLRARAG
jgi:hypothetical protein